MKLPESPLVLPKLPYELYALEPIISEESMSVHYFGHHKGYVDNYNKLLLEEGKKEDKEFNYNGHILHSLLWKNLCTFPSKPSKKTVELIETRYPSFDYFFESVINIGASFHGSGWLYVDSELNLKTIPNHEVHLVNSMPLLIIDLWEHYYYIDWHNDKKGFLNNLDKIINWNVISKRYHKRKLDF